MNIDRLKALVPRRIDPAQFRLDAAALRVSVWVSSMSIRYKIAGALIAVLCMAIASLGVFSFKQQKETLRAEMQRRAEVLSRQLAATGKTGLLSRDDLVVYSTIKELHKMPDVVYAMVVDNKGKVFAHTILKEKGGVLSNPPDRAALEAKDLLFQQTFVGRKPVLEAAFPIISNFAGQTLRVGTARVGLSEESLVAAIHQQKLAFVSITSAFVVLGLVISFGLGQLLTRQIVILIGVMRIVAQGNFSQLASIETRDEIGKLAENFNNMILGLREKLHMEKYLSTSTLKLIKRLRDSDHMILGGERRRVTVLFSDIRGFTAMTEALRPEEVVQMLNLYLNLQAEVIYSRGGAIDKFVGDEVMALFTDKDANYQAALAAREILNFVKALNDARARSGRRPISVGIGLNTGEVILGNMGAERQMDYTAIGDPINTAARLCGQAEPGQAVMSRSVAVALKGLAEIKELPPVLLKGKKGPIDLFELLEVPEARKTMRRRVNATSVCRLAGIDEQFSVSLQEVGAQGCTVETSFPLASGAQLDVDITLGSLAMTQRARGVVRRLEKGDSGYRAELEFENLEEAARDLLTEWVHRIESPAAEPVSPPQPRASVQA